MKRTVHIKSINDSVFSGILQSIRLHIGFIWNIPCKYQPQASSGCHPYNTCPFSLAPVQLRELESRFQLSLPLGQQGFYGGNGLYRYDLQTNQIWRKAIQRPHTHDEQSGFLSSVYTIIHHQPGNRQHHPPTLQGGDTKYAIRLLSRLERHH